MKPLLHSHRMVSGAFLMSLAVVSSILFSSCSSTKHANARFDKTVAKLEKKNRKKGRKVEVDDLYYSKKDVEYTTTENTTASVSYNDYKEAIRKEKPSTNVSKSRKVNTVLSTAKSYLGTPHVLGGMTKRGIDCSGLMIQSFKKVNINLPRLSSDQAKTGKKVSIKEVKEGDLLFFSPSANKVSHVGVVSYVGRNEIRFIHTSTSKGVREDDLFSDYWRKSFVRARRVL